MNENYIDCISVENTRESDRLTIERYVSGRTLMYRAALGVYRAVNWRGEIAIAVGGGNNGGDGYALACILADENIPCRIIKLSPLPHYKAQRKADGGQRFFRRESERPRCACRSIYGRCV